MASDPTKTRFAKCNQGARRCKQLVRMMQMCEMLRRHPCLVRQLADRFEVSERTIRRDLDVLASLNWVEVKPTITDQSLWYWIKDSR